MASSQVGSLAAAKSLYRSLLRAHARHLPAEMRQLGDAYVKAEFRLHSASYSKASTAMKPHQIQHFLAEWQQYLDQILLTAKAQESVSAGSPEHVEKSRSVFSFGKDLPPNVELTEEQKSQLEKLREEASKR
jgi:hypothetical protein